MQNYRQYFPFGSRTHTTSKMRFFVTFFEKAFQKLHIELYIRYGGGSRYTSTFILQFFSFISIPIYIFLFFDILYYILSFFLAAHFFPWKLVVYFLSFIWLIHQLMPWSNIFRNPVISVKTHKRSRCINCETSNLCKIHKENLFTNAPYLLYRDYLFHKLCI